MPSAVKIQSPNHWASREVAGLSILEQQQKRVE